MNLARLGDHAKFLSGFAFKSKFFNADGIGLPVVRIRDVVRGYSETFYSGEYDERYVVSCGEYLIGMDGEFNLARWQSEKSLLNQRVCKIDTISDDVDRDYLSRFLPVALKEIEDTTPFVTVKHLSVKALNEIQIPLPPLTEQKRIAEILGAADALRSKRRESLTQLDTLLQSTFVDMFGDIESFLSIGEILSDGTLEVHKDGNHGSLYPRAHEFGESGIPFLSAKCISDQGDLLTQEIQLLNETKARTLKLGWIKGGDVLLAHNASVGKTFLYRGEFDEALIGTSLTAFRPNTERLDSAYLLGALRSQGFQQQLFANMGQTTRNQVPISAQRRLSIPLPALDQQQRFAAIAEAIEQQKASQRAHLNELDTLFASIQSRAFRGDL